MFLHKKRKLKCLKPFRHQCLQQARLEACALCACLKRSRPHFCTFLFLSVLFSVRSTEHAKPTGFNKTTQETQPPAWNIALNLHTSILHLIPLFFSNPAPGRLLLKLKKKNRRGENLDLTAIQLCSQCYEKCPLFNGKV